MSGRGCESHVARLLLFDPFVHHLQDTAEAALGNQQTGPVGSARRGHQRQGSRKDAQQQGVAVPAECVVMTSD
ncbi:MAG: hypothetical protein ACOCXX_04670 [Planctomycetota bacterium]